MSCILIQLDCDIKLLIDSLHHTENHIGQSKARVTCPKCDQHYWKKDKIQSKGHLTVCRRAQSVQTKLLLQEHSPNHNVPPSKPTVSSDDDPLQKNTNMEQCFLFKTPLLQLIVIFRNGKKIFNGHLSPSTMT